MGEHVTGEPPSEGSQVSRRAFLLGTTGAVVVASLPRLAGSASAAGGSCDPFTAPSFRGIVPSPQDVLGFPLGSQPVTVAESAAYLDAVTAASDRIVTGSYGTSVQGRPLRYAILGRTANVTPAGLTAIRDATATIRNPATPASEVASLAASTPAILWIIANIHGNEPSGADAALEIVYELADRDDCAANQILDNAVVVVAPIQNPDGREAGTRGNANGFDLNRDLFTRTQPETDTKVELMRGYPPLALVDSHESGYYQSFFPPNNDPIYHEISEGVVHWINDLYGPAMSKIFEARGWGYLHGKVYDFFSPDYDDTMTSNGFLGAGMTVEIDHGKAFDQRVIRHYTADWAVLSRAATGKTAILRELHQAVADAQAEGRRGRLQRNHRYFRERKPVRVQVPDRLVRHYFLLEERGKSFELQTLVRRLQHMGVHVRRLSAPLEVPDFRPYGRLPQAATLPAGTYWVSMEQPQKHWIQVMLNESTYMYTLTTYGISGWSGPLLNNLDGGSSGEKLKPTASPVGPVASPPPPVLPSPLPKVGMFQISNGSWAVESAGAARWVFDELWHLPYEEISAAQIATGWLDGLDVLVAPGGGAKAALGSLGQAGADNLRAWVEGGGRYVGYRYGGAKLAAELGLTTTVLTTSNANIPGSLLRARVGRSSPLGAGVGGFVWVFFVDDLLLRPQGAAVPVRFPTGASGDAFVSGFAQGEENLYGTAAVTDEVAGSGRVILFGSDPASRGYTLGTARILWNAILGPDPAATTAAAGTTDRSAAGRAAAVAVARDAARALPPWDAWMTLTVPAADEREAKQALQRFISDFRIERDGTAVRFLFENRGELTLEEHPWATQLLVELQLHGVQISGLSGA